MREGSMVIKDGVRIVQGTPTAPLQRPALFLRLWRVVPAKGPARTMASLATARPTSAGYAVKDLIADMQLEPKEALEKAVAIARRGEVEEIYVNADLSKLPVAKLARAG